MDKKKLVYENKKILKKIEEVNKKAPEKNASRIADEEAVILKDSLDYLGKRLPKDKEDADKKIDEVIKYHKPKWVKSSQTSRKVFFIESGERKKVNYDINEFYRKLFGIK